MLGSSRLYSKSPSLVWQIAIPRSLVLLILLHFINGANVVAQNLQNITIPVTSSQIIYTPFVCNASMTLTDAQLCSGAWRLSKSNKSVSTTGPSSSGSILPQLFFKFQASLLSIKTLPSSNASVNITISTGGIQTISSIFNFSLGASVVRVGLVQSQITLLSVTYIPSVEPTLFGLESFIITVPENSPTNSFLPSPTLPSFTSTQASTSTSSSASVTAAETSSKNTMVAEAVGITIGLGVGLTAIAVAVFYYWKRRKLF